LDVGLEKLGTDPAMAERNFKAMSDPEVIYNPIRCETRIGDFKVSDQMLAEMGLKIEDLLARVDFTSEQSQNADIVQKTGRELQGVGRMLLIGKLTRD
jgi:hypothetical protein